MLLNGLKIFKYTSAKWQNMPMSKKGWLIIGNAQDDITGYLNGIALQDKDIQHFHISTRLTRLFLNHLKTNDLEKLSAYVGELVSTAESD